MLSDTALVDRLKAAGLPRHREQFTWNEILQDYERLLTAWS